MDDDEDSSLIEDPPAATDEEIKAVKTALVEDENRLPIPSDPTTLRGSFLTKLFIFSSRPQCLHHLVFDALSTSTRAAHARILRKLRGMDADLARWPLPKAVVEYVLPLALLQWVLHADLVRGDAAYQPSNMGPLHLAVSHIKECISKKCVLTRMSSQKFCLWKFFRSCWKHGSWDQRERRAWKDEAGKA